MWPSPIDTDVWCWLSSNTIADILLQCDCTILSQVIYSRVVRICRVRNVCEHYVCIAVDSSSIVYLPLLDCSSVDISYSQCMHVYVLCHIYMHSCSLKIGYGTSSGIATYIT